MSDLFSAVVSHQIGLERAKAGETKAMRKLLAEIDKKVIAEFSSLPAGFTNGQLNAVIAKINNDVELFYSDKVISLLGNVGRRTVDIEVDFARNVVDRYLSGGEFVATPVKDDVFAKGMAMPYQQKTLPNWGRDLATDKINRINSAAKTAKLMNGDIGAAVGKQIKIANHNADTITKAYINQFSNVSRDAVYQENNNFVDKISWSSILDHSTTITCGVRSNKRYDAATKEPIGHIHKWEGGPGIIHFNCRSMGIPENKSGKIASGTGKGEKIVDGERTAIGGEKGYKRGDNKTSRGKVAKIPTVSNSLEKQIVPADLDYESWLKTQPKQFVEDVLGVKKAELFLDEKVSLGKFVVADGTELTLQQFGALR